MTQVELQAIFDKLLAGDRVDGWGHARHADFDMLFTRSEEWRRDKGDLLWKRQPSEALAGRMQAN
jgi:hypothetical protein